MCFGNSIEEGELVCDICVGMYLVGENEIGKIKILSLKAPEKLMICTVFVCIRCDLLVTFS